jgi:DNA polymerase, archaea type
MSDGGGAYNRYFGRLNTGKMKIRGVMARKGDTPEYARRMQQDLFDILAQARGLDELRMIEPVAREVREKYIRELEDANVTELATDRRVNRMSRMNYSRRCAEASAVKAYQKRGLPIAMGYGGRICGKRCFQWEVDTERDASEFDAGYYEKLLEKAWKEVAFILATHN